MKRFNKLTAWLNRPKEPPFDLDKELKEHRAKQAKFHASIEAIINEKNQREKELIKYVDELLNERIIMQNIIIELLQKHAEKKP